MKVVQGEGDWSGDESRTHGYALDDTGRMAESSGKSTLVGSKNPAVGPPDGLDE